MDAETDDFCSKIIDLKSKGFFIEDVGSQYGQQFDGLYRWMNTETGEFQDGEMSVTELEAWVECIKTNVKTTAPIAGLQQGFCI